MKKLNSDFIYLKDMYNDDYYPKFLVDKVKNCIAEMVYFLEKEEYKDLEEVQEKLDEMTIKINELEEEFEENDSKIETVARDSIGVTVENILKYFEINIDIEEAIREREW